MRTKHKAALFVPIYITIMSTLYSYMVSDQIVTFLVVAYPIALYLYTLITNRHYDIVSIIISLFVFYLFFNIILNSSDIIDSMSRFVRYVAWLGAYVIGYVYIKSSEVFNKMISIYVYCLLYLLIDLIVVNITGLGTYKYLEEGISFGGHGLNVTKSMALLVMIAVLYLRNSGNRGYNILISSASIITIIVFLVGLKRGVIGAFVVGLIALLIMWPNRTRITLYTSFALIVLIALSPLYLDSLTDRFFARERQMLNVVQGSIYEEGRFEHDLVKVLNEHNNGDIWHKMFGSEPLRNRIIDGRLRLIHIDITRLLDATGLVGLFFYLSIMILIFSKIVRINTVDKKYERAIAISVFVYLVTLTYTGSLNDVLLRSLAFLFFGATISKK